MSPAPSRASAIPSAISSIIFDSPSASLRAFTMSFIAFATSSEADTTSSIMPDISPNESFILSQDILFTIFSRETAISPNDFFIPSTDTINFSIPSIIFCFCSSSIGRPSISPIASFICAKASFIPPYAAESCSIAAFNSPIAAASSSSFPPTALSSTFSIASFILSMASFISF